MSIISTQEFKRGRSDTLNIQSEGEEMTPVTLVATMTPDPEVNSEPSQAELAQCEAEVGTLLSIIAELNRKMGALQAPRCVLERENILHGAVKYH